MSKNSKTVESNILIWCMMKTTVILESGNGNWNNVQAQHLKQINGSDTLWHSAWLRYVKLSQSEIWSRNADLTFRHRASCILGQSSAPEDG